MFSTLPKQLFFHLHLFCRLQVLSIWTSLNLSIGKELNSIVKKQTNTLYGMYGGRYRDIIRSLSIIKLYITIIRYSTVHDQGVHFAESGDQDQLAQAYRLLLICSFHYSFINFCQRIPSSTTEPHF